MLISCGIDGELSSDESGELSSHLDECSACRLRSAAFGRVNGLVICLGHAAEGPAMKVADSVVANVEIASKQTQTSLWTRSVPYAALVALAAALVVWLGVVMPGTKQASASEIVVPIVSLAHINSARQEDQAIFKESLELEMRTLRLEIKLLDDKGASKNDLEKQYEQLMRRIKET